MTTQIEKIEWQADSTSAVRSIGAVNRALSETSVAGFKVQSVADGLDRAEREMSKLFRAIGVGGNSAAMTLFGIAGEAAGLTGALGPLGLAIGVVSGAVLLWAEENRRAEESLKAVADATKQSDAFIAGLQKSIDDVTESSRKYVEAVGGITSLTQYGIGERGAAELTKAAEKYLELRGQLSGVTREIRELSAQYDELSAGQKFNTDADARRIAGLIEQKQREQAALLESLDTLDKTAAVTAEAAQAEQEINDALEEGKRVQDEINKARERGLVLRQAEREAAAEYADILDSLASDIEAQIEQSGPGQRATEMMEAFDDFDRSKALRDEVAQKDKVARIEQQRIRQREREMQQLARTTALIRSQTAALEGYGAAGMAAFASVGAGITDTFFAVATGTKGVGEAVRDMVRDALLAYGREAAVKGIFYTAEGFAALASFNPASASNFFSAAGQMFATAAAAGVGAAAVSAIGGASAGGGSGERATRAERSGGVSATDSVNFAQRNRELRGEAPPIIININGPATERSVSQGVTAALREAGRYGVRYGA